jgi:hypothetical protein
MEPPDAVVLTCSIEVYHANCCTPSYSMGVFGSSGELSHLSHVESSYAAYIRLIFIVVCLIARVS